MTTRKHKVAYDPFEKIGDELTHLGRLVPERNYEFKTPESPSPIKRPIRKPITDQISEEHKKSEESPSVFTDTNDFTVTDESLPFYDPSDKSKEKVSPDNQYIPIFHYYIRKGLQGQKLLLYALICSRVMLTNHHEFSMGKNTIAEWIGIKDPANVSKLMKELKTEGLIIQLEGKKGKFGTNVYTLPKEDLAKIEDIFEEAYVLQYYSYTLKKNPFEST